ncbi:MAG: hypothetical protein IJ008_03530 [Clostridia bacterium]|nr:hypothetical protein [Clostridia bacterium]
MKESFYKKLKRYISLLREGNKNFINYLFSKFDKYREEEKKNLDDIRVDKLLIWSALKDFEADLIIEF